MQMEAVRRAEGRIAAWRCLEASRIAVDDRTRDALERCAVRYMFKAIGIDARDEVAPAPGVCGDAGAGLTWEAHDEARQTFTRGLGLGDGARDWEW
jgi:hypothetical protein